MERNEEQLELLEACLDGELPSGEAESLRARLGREPGLAAELDQLRAERASRVAAFAGMEGDEGIADRLIARARVQVDAPAKRQWRMPWRYAAAAAAACLVLGFVAGQWLDMQDAPGITRLTPVAHESSYRVAITDEDGQVIAIQKFDSLEQATEFSDDLRQWQERQEQIRNGQVIVRSAHF